MRPGALALTSTLVLASACSPATDPARNRLVGFAFLPPHTFRPGPTSGRFLEPTGDLAGDHAPPYEGEQPVQGFSAMLEVDGGNFLVLSDNGYGTKANSPDYVLRFYRIQPELRTASGGAGSIAISSFVSLSDPFRRIPFPIVADADVYPGSEVPVDPRIKEGRLLTGADLDIESFRRMPDGTFWFGDEFGPFLIHTDAEGRVIDPPVALDGVAGPDDPLGRPATLGGSAGFEGMSIDAAGTRLYPMLEKPLEPSERRRVAVHEFDAALGRYTGRRFHYRLEDEAVAIGEFSPVTDDLHLVIERDDEEGAAARFKKIYLVDLRDVDPEEDLPKAELVDLLDLDDPDDLDGDGALLFRFPFLTIESVVAVDERTIAVVNDNNYPFGMAAEEPRLARTELILVRLGQPLRRPANSLHPSVRSE